MAQSRYATGDDYTGEALITAVICQCGARGQTTLYVNDRGALDYERDDLCAWNIEVHKPGVYGGSADVRCPKCRETALHNPPDP